MSVCKGVCVCVKGRLCVCVVCVSSVFACLYTYMFVCVSASLWTYMFVDVHLYVHVCLIGT